MSQLSVQRLRVLNSDSQPITVHIEPWGEQIRLRPDESLDVIFEGPEGAYPEVQYETGNVIVNGWTGSVASVYQVGNLLKDLNIPVPETPKRR